MSDASTHKFTINHSLTPGKETPQAAAVRKQREETAKTVRARRQKIHEQAAADAAGASMQQTPDRQPVQAPVREDIESIEIPLPNGVVVEYGPPRGVSLQDRIVRMYSGRPFQDGGPDPGVTEYRMTRVLMGVRSLDGRPVQCNDLIQRTKLANSIGDDGIDLLFYYDRLYWPPMTEAELPVIKKRLRNQPSDS